MCWNPFTKWYYVRATYYIIDENGKRTPRHVKLHHFLLNVPFGDTVDHKDHNGLDNRKENLRYSEHVSNGTNRKSKNSNNTTGYRNLIYDKRSDTYTIMLCIKNKRFRVGKIYTDVHEAGRDAEMYRKQYYGEFAGEN